MVRRGAATGAKGWSPDTGSTASRWEFSPGKTTCLSCAEKILEVCPTSRCREGKCEQQGEKGFRRCIGVRWGEFQVVENPPFPWKIPRRDDLFLREAGTSFRVVRCGEAVESANRLKLQTPRTVDRVEIGGNLPRTVRCGGKRRSVFPPLKGALETVEVRLDCGGTGGEVAAVNDAAIALTKDG